MFLSSRVCRHQIVSKSSGCVLKTIAQNTFNTTRFSSTNVESIMSHQVLSSHIDELARSEEYRKQHEITIRGIDAKEFHPFTEFDSTPFLDKLKKVFNSEQYSQPTPIQAQAWPIILNKRDVISVARTEKTSSGKRSRYPKVLVVAPTRELSMQIDFEAVKFANACGLKTLCVYGGSSKYPQLQALGSGIDLLVGTPGRINDLIEMGALNLREVEYVVLDEADRMLDMGFEPQIRQILSNVPKQRQNVFFSATWPKEVQLLASEFLNNPVMITAGQPGVLTANAAIKQHVIIAKIYEKEEKFTELLRELIESSGKKLMPKCIVFMARKYDCDSMAAMLRDQGIASAGSLHGDMSQSNRTRTMDLFRKGSIRVLVATDVAARGLDVKDVEVVVNYDFPSGLEDYVHRIGRTGRGENTGRAYAFLTPNDNKIARELINLMKRSNQEISAELKQLGSTGDDRDTFGQSAFRNRYSAPGNSRKSNAGGRSFGGSVKSYGGAYGDWDSKRSSQSDNNDHFQFSRSKFDRNNDDSNSVSRRRKFSKFDDDDEF